MNLNLLFFIILILFNYSKCENLEETILNKKIDLKSTNSNLESSKLNLDQTDNKLNISDPSLKNISDKLSSDDKISLKKISERETKDDKEIKDNSSITNKLITPTKDDLIINSNGNKKKQHKTKDKKQNIDTQLTTETNKQIQTKQQDDLPSFDEWKKKVVEEEPNNQQNLIINNSNNKKSFNSNSIKDNKLRIRNYASSECGAKVINSNKEAQGSYKILIESQDEYMLNPCNSKIWFIIELCEAIKLSSIEVANYELFSSTFRDFLIYGSGHYPTRDWHLLGNFTANDVKQVQVFSFNGENEYRKFIKIEILSHHGSEHFCPFSLVRMFGTSMTDEFDELDGDKIMDNKLLDENIEVLEKEDKKNNKKNYLNEKSVFYKILVKVAEFFYKNQPKSDRTDTKEENFAKFLRDRDTLDAIIEQSIMNIMPQLEPKLKLCLNLDKQTRKQRNKRIKFCNYLRTLVGATTFDLLIKEMSKDDELKFKCLMNTNSTSLNHDSNKTIDDQFNEKSQLESSSMLDKKFDSIRLELSDKLNNELKSNLIDSLSTSKDSIEITLSSSSTTNEEKLILPTPTNVLDSNIELSSTLNNLDLIKNNDHELATKKDEKLIALENNKQLESDESIKNNDELEKSIDQTSSTTTNDQQIKSIEKSSDQQQIQSSKIVIPSTEDELPNGTPLSGSSSKETIFIRMINKIKSLELNLSLSSQYLEELSQRYRRQMDEMQKNFNQTIFKLNETSKIAADKDNRQQLLLDKLGSKITDLEDKLFILIGILIETCIQNRDLAILNGRQCLRKCKQNSDCISARKRCLCDGLCGWSCVRPDLSCDLLKQIDNGSFIVTGNFFNAKVTYTCNKGFYLSGLKERICQGDGSWTGSPPICTEHAECGAPPTIPHARVNFIRNSYKIDSIIEYSCFVGYEPKGNNKTKCEFRNEIIQWILPDFKCVPISCGIPGDIENGYRDSHSQFLFNRRITFSCNEGFTLQGNKNDIVCQSNGQWSSPLPHCTRSWTNQEKVVCNPINCEAIGKADNVQIFVSTPISEATETPLDSNSQLPSSFIDDSEELGNRKWVIGTILQFRCAGDAQLNALVNYSRCDEDAQWSHPIPNCMNSCMVPKIVNATILDLNPGQLVKHGSTFKIACQDDYEIAYNDLAPTCTNGTFTNLPVCIPASCKSFPKAPANGIIFAPYQHHNARGEIYCNDGYQLIGDNYVYCHFGKWTTNEMSRCEEVYCKFPGTINNGRVLLVGSMGLYEYRSYVKKVKTNRQLIFECDKGFQLIGPTASTCLNGVWYPNEQLPKCVANNYSSLISIQTNYPNKSRRKRFISILNNNQIIKRESICLLPITNYTKVRPSPYKTLPNSSKLIYLHGTKIEQLECAKGYLPILGKNQNAICLENGEWYPQTPSCKPSKCLVERIVNNAIYYTTDGHILMLTINSTLDHDQLVNIKCLPGFKLNGENSFHCYYGELNAVYVHDILFKITSKDPNKEIIHWPTCLPDSSINTNDQDYLSLNDYNQEKKQLQLMIRDDLDELKKLDKNRLIDDRNYRENWCSRPNKLKSILKHIDKLKGVGQLKSKLIGIVELDHNNLNNTILSFRNRAKIYPPGSQIFYRCIKYGNLWTNNYEIENLILNSTDKIKDKSSWLLTCSNGSWTGYRVACRNY